MSEILITGRGAGRYTSTQLARLRSLLRITPPQHWPRVAAAWQAITPTTTPEPCKVRP